MSENVELNKLMWRSLIETSIKRIPVLSIRDPTIFMRSKGSKASAGTVVLHCILDPVQIFLRLRNLPVLNVDTNVMTSEWKLG